MTILGLDVLSLVIGFAIGAVGMRLLAKARPPKD